jgi:uncharacterized protein with PIN domain
MKFLCDQMLSRLGKWLRIAGYDTSIVEEEGLSDLNVLDQALSENRLLITRDRHFLQMKKAAPILIYLRSNDFLSCREELNHHIPIDWLYAPFSRCLNCNMPLERVIEESLKDIPEKIRQQKNNFWFCSNCRKFFWEGSHTDKMLGELKLLQKK